MKRRNIKQEISDALNKYPDGLTMIELACVIKADYETVRVTIQRARPAGVYIDKWVRVSKGPCSAIFKIVPVPDDAPKPERSTHDEVVVRNVVKPMSKDEKRLNALPTQGLTQIRGPWPTHH